MSGNSDASGVASDSLLYDSATSVYDDPDSSKHAAIPPVPPLPKVWEGSRSSSLTSEAFRAAIGKSPGMTPSQSFVSTMSGVSGDHSDKLPPPKSPLSPRTQELAEVAALAVRKPSLGKLSDAPSRGSSTNDVSMQCGVTEPIEEMMSSSDPPVAQETSFTASNASEAGIATTPSRPKSSSLRRASVASLGRLIRTGQKDKDLSQPPSSAGSQTQFDSADVGTSPKARRTPAFFQRASKSSDGPSAVESSSQDSGRLSRKSLLGIAGGLLSRSGSRRNAAAKDASTASPSASHSNVSQTDSRSSGSHQDASPVRRRGQVVPGATVLIQKQPASSTSTQEPRSTAKPAADGLSADSAANPAQTPFAFGTNSCC